MFLNKIKKLNYSIKRACYSTFNGLTGGEIIYEKLSEKNVKNVFLYTGGAIMPVIDPFFNQNKINYYINTHEQSGGHAATGYAKATGQPGISIVTSGPGLTNSVTPLTDANNDGVPLIVLSGQVPLAAMGTQAFQECPSVDITKSITKWSYLVKDVHELPDVIDEAFRVSTNGKPGSVHIDLPKCITAGKFNHKYYQYKKFNNKIIQLNDINKTSFENVSNLINRSKKPVFLLGQGCNDSSHLITEIALKNNIPVTTTIHAMGCFDETNDLSLEFLGMHGNVAANYAMQNADLIIALGTRFDDRITGNIQKFAPEAAKAYKNKTGGIVHVNVNDSEINKVLNTNYNFHTTCSKFLKGIKPHIKKSNRLDWLNTINNWKNKHKFDYNKSSNIKTQDVICQINKYLLERNKIDYAISTGVGNHQMMAAQFIKWKYPFSVLTSGSLGTMGVGLPYAIGCQIAFPNKLVIDIDGDGSFNHTLSELKTVKNYNLPIKIAVLNDCQLSMVTAWEKLFFKERYTATDLNENPDYKALAESYGIKAISCEKLSDLESATEYFLNYNGPILCDFKVEPDLCLPLVAPNSALDDIVLFDKKENNVKIDTNNSLPPG